MTTTRRDYVIEGKDVGTLKGTTVQFLEFGSIADVASHVGDEVDTLELIQSAFDVWMQGRVRAMAKKGKSAADIQAWIDTAKYARRIEGVGAPKSKGTGEVKAAKAAKAEFDALKTKHLEKALTDPKHLKKAIEFEIFKQAEFDRFKAEVDAGTRTVATAEATA
jgi:hypothetical protein